MASSNKALVQENGKLSVREIDPPVPGPYQLLIKVSHVAQNPTDILSFDGKAFGDGTILGCDFVGTVERRGSEVTRIQEGQVIAGLIWGGETKWLGGYSEYTIADEKICFPVPSEVSLASAATVPLASCTSLLAFFSENSLNIPRVPSGKETVLVWGGSSSVGQYALQIARLYGLDAITTCSPRNFDVVKACGARVAFDYNDNEVVEKIRSAAPGLKYVFDTIGNETSSKTASQAIHESGGTLCTVRPGKVFTENVSKQTKVTDVLVWTAFLKDHQYKDAKFPANKKDHEMSADFFNQLPQLLIDNKITPSNVKILSGLESVLDGFQEYRDGKISNYKIVYEL